MDIFFGLKEINGYRASRSAINTTFSVLQRRLGLDPWIPLDTTITPSKVWGKEGFRGWGWRWEWRVLIAAAVPGAGPMDPIDHYRHAQQGGGLLGGRGRGCCMGEGGDGSFSNHATALPMCNLHKSC